MSFIKRVTALRLGCKLQLVKPLLIWVANGQQLMSDYEVPGFTWSQQGVTLTYTLQLLNSVACDIILDCDWIKHNTALHFIMRR